MTLSEVKTALQNQDKISFQLPDGSLVPAHFHVTEIGKVSKEFIDCGGTMRAEETISFQLWSSVDYNHRLHPEKLVHIIDMAEEKLGLSDAEIEVEYQGNTIEKYALNHTENGFLLVQKNTDCLAKSDCGIPATAIQVKNLVTEGSDSCTPGGGCC